MADGDRLMTEYEVYSYEAFKKKIQDELREAERAEYDDIKTPAFSKYLIEIKNKKANLSKKIEMPYLYYPIRSKDKIEISILSTQTFTSFGSG